MSLFSYNNFTLCKKIFNKNLINRVNFFWNQFFGYGNGEQTRFEDRGLFDFENVNYDFEFVLCRCFDRFDFKNKRLKCALVFKDVILLSFGAFFQSVDGIAIRRNDAELKNTYEITKFDPGTLNYEELLPDVFHFTAGL